MIMHRYTSVRGRALALIMFFWFIWFMNFSVRTIYSPIMPLIEDEFLVSHGKASSLFTFTSIGYGTSLFLSGLLSGFFGYKRSIIFSLIISTICFFTISFVKEFNPLILISFMLGISTGIYLPSIIPLITDYFEGNTWGRVLAIHDSAASLSIFSAPFIAIFLLGLMNWRQMFIVFGVIFIILTVLFSLISKELKVPRIKAESLGNLFRDRYLWLMGLVWISAAGACLGVYFVIPLYLSKELALPVDYANKIFGISRLGGIFVAISTGFVVDRFSIKRLLFFLILITGVLTMLLAYRDIGIVKIMLFLQASISTGFFPIGLVYISKIFDKEHRSMATGFIVTLGVIFGLGIVPYLLGVAGDIYSFRMGIFLYGVLVCLSSGLTFLLK
ncbi:MAG TPA: MFS transporter [Syntrophorhabdaceae bacterium]|nr:MFS transporter [Syntrophorhabdaceae bacterium]HOL04870.1 MFS transporter [Syntrophorhabdaceae bacterium]HPP41673.1 MFS transporter [Syntrophorhabdaceae bacterium]